MDNNIIAITREVKEKINLEEFNIKNPIILPNNSSNILKRLSTKESTLHIYDLGFNNSNKITPIKNHINKTVINPLREYKNKNIKFYDITTIYKKQGNGKIAECFGSHEPTLKNTKYIQTRFLCNHVIMAYFLGFKNIYAYVIK